MQIPQLPETQVCSASARIDVGNGAPAGPDIRDLAKRYSRARSDHGNVTRDLNLTRSDVPANPNVVHTKTTQRHLEERFDRIDSCTEIHVKGDIKPGKIQAGLEEDCTHQIEEISDSTIKEFGKIPNGPRPFYEAEQTAWTVVRPRKGSSGNRKDSNSDQIEDHEFQDGNS